jgi:hypothetical protein
LSLGKGRDMVKGLDSGSPVEKGSGDKLRRNGLHKMKGPLSFTYLTLSYAVLKCYNLIKSHNFWDTRWRDIDDDEKNYLRF